MSASSEFNEHTGLLYDSLRELLGRSAIQVTPEQTLGTGLLNNRSSGHGKALRPRLVIVSGMADLVGRILGETVRSDLLVVGATIDEETRATIKRIYAACPGTAKNLLQRTDLEGEEVVKLSHSAHIAEPQACNAEQANLFYQEIRDQLTNGHE